MREISVRGGPKRRSLAPNPRVEKSLCGLIWSLGMTRVLSVGLLPLLLFSLLSCSQAPDRNTLVMIIESSPTNLDPRVGIDAYSERIDSLIFDDLLNRDEHLNVTPGLAERWEIPDPLTYVFHIRRGVRFHDGRALTARDVKWTFDSLLQGKIRTTRAAAYRYVDRVEAPDDYTVVFQLKEPFSTLLWNLSAGAMGVVPYGSLTEITNRPIGSGPFRFVSAEMDKEVVLERNDDYWGEKAHVERVRLTVVPDTTTRALELRKGSADIVSNALPPDMVLALENNPNLRIEHGPGTVLNYLSFNLRDPILRDVRVRQAIAYAIDRRIMIRYLWRNFAQPAASILPPQSWAYNPDVPKYDYSPEKANKILDDAGYPETRGVRFHLTMKTSTEEAPRLIAAVLQQQLRAVGIELDIRTFEFATFFADVTSGAYQMYSLRWIGGNEDPDIFEYAYDSEKFPPHGANRSFYVNPKLDALVNAGRAQTDLALRKPIYGEIQTILATDLPSINLWFLDNVLVHSKRVQHVPLNPEGNYDFLRTAEIVE
jgi:peptide/nickel transport system substrate-binding protein